MLDIAELTWDILRLQRWKTAILNKEFVPALEEVLTKLLDQAGYDYAEAIVTAEDMAHRWFTNRRIRSSGARLLRQFKLDEAAVEAQAYIRSGEKLEQLDKLLASAESRLHKA